MADLFARFRFVDEISAKMSQAANAGIQMLNNWQNAGQAANRALSDVDKTAESVSNGIEDASRSITSFERAASGVSYTADNLSSSLEGVGDSASGAAEQTDYWTDAIGNYDKGAMEAIYTTEELVEMGFKTQEALEAEARAAARAADAAEDLGNSAEEAAEKQEDMGKKGVDAVSAIGNTLIGAAIAKTLKESAEAAYELADAFSDAESTIVIATGASGAALDSLTGSMMRVYAASKTGSLDDTAAAIGEINTRLGYTDKRLETTTALFLDFTSVAGGDVAVNVKNVTQLMRQWEIEDTKLERTLDKLTYAGQVSGKSVGTLTSELTANKAILDELGFSLDESIAMFSKFELNGTQAATVMTGFRTALSNGTISSLEDLYEVFDRIATGEINAADAGKIFGARAGAGIVNAVRNGTFALDELVSALEKAEGTTVRTAEVSQTLGQKWEQAGNNIEAAFTTAIEPVTNKMSSGLASITNKFGDFLNQHPAVTKAITAVGAGLGAATVAIGGLTFATKVAIPAVAAFGTAFMEALGPVGWAAVAIGAVTTAVVAYTAMMDDAEDETLSMTATTRQQYLELQDLQSEYERACDAYGDTSDEASRLRYQLDDLTASFESNRQSVEDMTAEVRSVVDRHNELMESCDNGSKAIHNEEIANLALIAKLADMAASTDQSAASQAAMNAIIEELNGNLDGLDMSYEKLMDDQAGAVRTLREYAAAQAEMEMRQAKVEQYVELIKQQTIEQEKLADATAEAAAAKEWEAAALAAYNASSEYHGNYTRHGDAETKEYNAATKAASEAAAAQQELQDAYDETTRKIEELEAEWGRMNDAQEKSIDTSRTFKDVLTDSFSTVQDELDELCEAYNAAYESARSSIDSQIGLFATMKTETTTKVEDMQKAFASQLEYLTLYTENLRKAAQYGIDDGLVASLSDGSAESAGYIDAIIKKIEALGAESEGAKKFVTDFNKSFTDVQQAKDTFSETVAKMETDFDEKMGAIEDRLATSIESMDQSSDAAAAARATIDAYTKAIRDGTDSAVAAARSVSSGVSAALNSVHGSYKGLPRHAQGTDYAEDMFIAGEEGPELIQRATGELTAGKPEFFIAGQNGPELVVGEAGAKVYTSAETQQLLWNYDHADTQLARALPSEPVRYGDVINTSYDRTYDTDYAYDMSRVMDNSGDVSSITNLDSDDIVTASYDRAYDTDYAYDMSRNVENTTAITDATRSDPYSEYSVSYDRAYDTDYAYDMSRRLEDSTEIFGQNESVLGLLPEFVEQLLKRAFPVVADEERIVESGEERPLKTVPDGSGTGGEAAESEVRRSAEDTKRIYLEIAGSGTIGIDSGMDRDDVLEILQENIKPVLVGIIQEEIFEEGDGSYEF